MAGAPIVLIPTASLLGLPIHAGVGTVVHVTDESGRRTKGRVTKLGTASIDLDTAGRFEAATIQKIQVGDPVWGGVVVGGGVGLIAGGLMTLGCSSSCSSAGLLTPAGWGAVALGALVGGLMDAATMRHAYRRPEGARPTAPQWHLMPVGDGRGVQVRLRF